MKPPAKSIKKRVPKQAAKSFTATLERKPGGLGWTVVRIPFDAAKTWGDLGKFPVRGDINGFVFRTSLFSTGDRKHILLVNNKMQKAAHVRVGSIAEFRLELDLEERAVQVPPELKRLLGEEPQLRRWFDKLNYSMRKWIVDWVTQPKSTDSRFRRAEQVAEQLMSAMEAEQELPPAIRAAFAREPRALEGWNQMSPLQRRGQLLAIFYYRNPASRERRLAKTVDAAAAFAEKKTEK